jgi:hypothetical protein
MGKGSLKHGTEAIHITGTRRKCDDPLKVEIWHVRSWN